MAPPIFEPLQPFLFHSVVISIFLAFSTYITFRILNVQDHRLRSILYLVPMLIPLVTYATFLLPRILFPFRNFSPLTRGCIKFGGDAFDVHISGTRVFIAFNNILMPDTLFLLGLTFGTALLVFLYFFGSRAICWIQGVGELTIQENPLLMDMTRRLAERAGVPIPRVGINEDLRPNAFTIGWGKKTMMVVTSGLLKRLSEIELEAVLAHEIAHIKNRDFNFMALISILKAISFFNPLVYLLSPAIKKEREFLADCTGAELLDRPDALGLALTKIWEDSRALSGGFLKNLISGFFITSEIRCARNALTTHPTLESRLRNIADRQLRTKFGRDETLRVILVCTAITIISFHVFGLLIQTCFPFGRVYGMFFGPERFWFRLFNFPTTRQNLDLRPYITAARIDSRAGLNISYPLTLIISSIEMVVIFAIMLRSLLQNKGTN
ncbi:MAG: M48 family metalloprotease [Thermoproteota archaeon]